MRGAGRSSVALHRHGCRARRVHQGCPTDVALSFLPYHIVPLLAYSCLRPSCRGVSATVTHLLFSSLAAVTVNRPAACAPSAVIPSFTNVQIHETRTSRWEDCIFDQSRVDVSLALAAATPSSRLPRSTFTSFTAFTSRPPCLSTSLQPRIHAASFQCQRRRRCLR